MNDELCIIAPQPKSPKVNALRDIIKTEKVLKEISEGDYFGEIALILNTTRTCNVRAKTFCELNILNRQDFEAVVGKYEDERKLMEEIIMEKFNVNRGALDDSRDLSKVSYDHEMAMSTNSGTQELKQMVESMQLQMDNMMMMMQQNGGGVGGVGMGRGMGRGMGMSTGMGGVAGNFSGQGGVGGGVGGGGIGSGGMAGTMMSRVGLARTGSLNNVGSLGGGLGGIGGGAGTVTPAPLRRSSSKMGGMSRMPSMQKVVEIDEEERRKASLVERENIMIHKDEVSWCLFPDGT